MAGSVNEIVTFPASTRIAPDAIRTATRAGSCRLTGPADVEERAAARNEGPKALAELVTFHTPELVTTHNLVLPKSSP